MKQNDDFHETYYLNLVTKGLSLRPDPVSRMVITYFILLFLQHYSKILL